MIISTQQPLPINATVYAPASDQQARCAAVRNCVAHCYNRSIQYAKEHVTARDVRNIARVTFAGGLSTIGGILAGEKHAIAAMGFGAVLLGSVIGGIGNGFSTWLAWETDFEDRIKAVEQQYGLSSSMAPSDNQQRKKCISPASSRLACNLWRVTFAGALSTIGGIVAGEKHAVASMGFGAVLLGSVIGGVGNGVSTWLMWETNLEDRVAIVERRLGLTETPNQEQRTAYLKAERSRLISNILRATFAGSLSAIGGVIAGEQHALKAMGFGAVVFGSVVAGVGNAASTWLAWETNVGNRIASIERQIKGADAQAIAVIA
jgi:hypothetical protein